jgi:hypothetical protein
MDDALQSIHRGLDLCSNTVGLIQATYVLKRQKKWLQVLEYCDRALALEPHDAATLTQKGDALDELGRDHEGMLLITHTIPSLICCMTVFLVCTRAAKAIWEQGVAAEKRFWKTSSSSAFRWVLHLRPTHH